MNGENIGSLREVATNYDWETTTIEIPSTYFLAGENELIIYSSYLSSSNRDDFLISNIHLALTIQPSTEDEDSCNCSDSCSQAELDSQYQAGRQACIDNSASCGIEIGGEYDEAYEAGRQACINNPASCDIQINGNYCPNSAATFDMFTNTLHIPNFQNTY